MDGIIFGFFALSVILVISMVYNIMSFKRPGIYPPKSILKKRAGMMGTAGAASLVIGSILWWIAS
ncbi:5-bromo-4-chloroindolyl phosphate hydrolysis protein [Rossellomorea marisflavi]